MPEPMIKPTYPLACKSWVLLVVCVLGVIVMIAGDLWLKSWSFENVAQQPVDTKMHIETNTPVPGGERNRITLIPNVLAFQLTLNYGAVFGVGQGKRVLFLIFTPIALAFVIYFLLTSSRRAWPMHLALVLIAAGALGNFYDRAYYGAVRDMLYLFPDVELPFGLSWPGNGSTLVYPWIFNLADVQLVCGIFIIMARSFTNPILRATRTEIKAAQEETAKLKEDLENATSKLIAQSFGPKDIEGETDEEKDSRPL